MCLQLVGWVPITCQAERYFNWKIFGWYSQGWWHSSQRISTWCVFIGPQDNSFYKSQCPFADVIVCLSPSLQKKMFKVFLPCGFIAAEKLKVLSSLLQPGHHLLLKLNVYICFLLKLATSLLQPLVFEGTLCRRQMRELQSQGNQPQENHLHFHEMVWWKCEQCGALWIPCRLLWMSGLRSRGSLSLKGYRWRFGETSVVIWY